VMPKSMAQYVAYWRDFAWKRWSGPSLGHVTDTCATLTL
jgi:hypothetical protein